MPVADEKDFIATDSVTGLIVNGEAKAYPLRILIWPEIVNDTVSGAPASVTFCPLYNTAVVRNRRLDGKVLNFGTTRKHRNSDLVMYARQTESWRHQFLGTGIIGEMTRKTLKALPARLESWAKFKARVTKGLVQAPNLKGMRQNDANPYAGYDPLPKPFLYSGEMPANVPPLSHVVSTKDRSQDWSLDLLKAKKEICLADGLVFRWEPGQNSTLDTTLIAKGADIGNVTAQRNGKDVPYFMDFAFAFHAFFPKATTHAK